MRGYLRNWSDAPFRAAVFSVVRSVLAAVLQVAGVCVCVCGAPLHAQQVRKAEALAPEDLGFTKYIFEATAPARELVVFREDEYADGKLKSRFETISQPSAVGDKRSESVLLVDWGFLSGQGRGPRGGSYVLRAGASTHYLDLAQLRETESVGRGDGKNPPQASFTFEALESGKRVVQKFVFTIFTEAYDSVKHRHPNLPASGAGGWVITGPVENVK